MQQIQRWLRFCEVVSEEVSAILPDGGLGLALFGADGSWKCRSGWRVGSGTIQDTLCLGS